jgi:glycosyltransferase involved in cell wall biosynthesis
MNFSSNYLSKRILYPAFIPSRPHPELGIIVVIPCFNEPDIVPTLESLWNCVRPQCAVEVILVLNSAENAPTEILQANEQSLIKFNNWVENHQDEQLRFYAIHVTNLPKKDAGVGLARKVGMDEAVQRFYSVEKAHGIILGYDADSGCETNYLTEVYHLFSQHTKLNACSIHFEHPIEGNEFDQTIYQYITQYELYLRYYLNALRYAHFPYSYQTIGSSFAVRAGVYSAQGGMNKRKAGEDFYFLQKIIPLGNFTDLTSTKVIPSPRPSDRVPFGTGAAISKMATDKTEEYLTYNLAAFDQIKALVENCGLFYQKTAQESVALLKNSGLFGPSMLNFLKSLDFTHNIDQINRNSSSLKAFHKRFFNWFTAFQVLKFLNSAHPHYFKKQPIGSVAKTLAQKLDIPVAENADTKDLLIAFREFDKKQVYHPE